MPRYEFSDGKSNKFWEIKLEGDSFTTRYGKIGADGQTSTKTYDSDEKAKKEYEKVIKSKVKKGYKLIEGALEEASSTSSKGNPELEQAIFDDPNDAEAWQVYGDWLQTEGDPLGELIALGYAKSQAKGAKKTELEAKEKEILDANLDKWLGKDLTKAREMDENDLITFEWQFGFIKKARLSRDYDWEGPSVDTLVRGVLKSPLSRFMHELVIGLSDAEGENGYSAELLAISKAGKLPAMRRLHIGDFEFPDDTEISWTDVGNVGKVYPVLPNLEWLKVVGCGSELGKLKHNKLKELIVHSGGLPSSSVKSIAEAELPELVSLEVWFGSDNYGGDGDIKTLKKFFTSKGYPKLKNLGLMNAEFQNDIAEAIANSKILGQLETLDLSMGTMTGDGAKAILDNAAAFKHLKRLNVGDNFIPDEYVEKLTKEFGGMIAIGDQEEPDDDYLYVSVSE